MGMSAQLVLVFSKPVYSLLKYFIVVFLHVETFKEMSLFVSVIIIVVIKGLPSKSYAYIGWWEEMITHFEPPCLVLLMSVCVLPLMPGQWLIPIISRCNHFLFVWGFAFTAESFDLVFMRTKSLAGSSFAKKIGYQAETSALPQLSCLMRWLTEINKNVC